MPLFLARLAGALVHAGLLLTMSAFLGVSVYAAGDAALSTPQGSGEIVTPPPPIAGRATVIDGDTIDIHGRRIRLWGIDAPESAQSCTDATSRPWRCGRRAAFALADRIGQGMVTCQTHDVDRYGRVVGVCSVVSGELNAWMVAEGWAMDFHRYSNGAYSARQQLARAGRKGAWTGALTPPWEFRRGPAAVAALAAVSPSLASPEDYQNCAAARAAGAAPIMAGAPGYSRRLDRDGDGVACER
jgi:endonuclease YncB( thermonuclease family)